MDCLVGIINVKLGFSLSITGIYRSHFSRLLKVSPGSTYANVNGCRLQGGRGCRSSPRHTGLVPGEALQSFWGGGLVSVCIYRRWNKSVNLS